LLARVDGPAAAPWIVFSNSVLTDLSIWDGQVAALSESYRLLRYDQRGHGGSDLPAGPMNSDGYGADLLAVLNAFEVEKCTFVGLSMGVPTGLAAVSRAPERFEGFVAVDGVAASAPGRESFWAERRETARTKGMDEIVQSTVPRWLPGADPAGPQAKSLADMISGTSVEGFAAATHALGQYDQSAALASLDCPFLGITGELDGAMPQAVRKQFAALSDASFVDIPKAGHVPNFQSVSAFNVALRAFLETKIANSIKELT
jgi:3-oxoadipate enol-lactonase